jgi:hypothetical protein
MGFDKSLDASRNPENIKIITQNIFPGFRISSRHGARFVRNDGLYKLLDSLLVGTRHQYISYHV